MILWWLATAAALAAALLAWRQARRTARRLEQLSQMYWELKYQHSELRSAVARQTGAVAPPAPMPEPPSRGRSFVPLSALKR